MDLRLQPFDFRAAVARAGLRPDGYPIGPVTAPVEGAGFQDAMAQALRSVSESQQASQQMQREFSLGNPSVSLEATMVAMQKSQIGFQAVLGVRNRMLQAYTEIMNMQV